MVLITSTLSKPVLFDYNLVRFELNMKLAVGTSKFTFISDRRLGNMEVSIIEQQSKQLNINNHIVYATISVSNNNFCRRDVCQAFHSQSRNVENLYSLRLFARHQRNINRGPLEIMWNKPPQWDVHEGCIVVMQPMHHTIRPRFLTYSFGFRSYLKLMDLSFSVSFTGSIL